MMSKLSGALGLALLAASLAFGGSVVYAQVPETEASALPAAIDNGNSENNAIACGLDRSDAAACIVEPGSDAQAPSAAPDDGQAPAPVAEVEPSATPEPGVTYYDAIVADVVETVTIATPGEEAAAGEEAAPGEEAAFTGTLQPDAAIVPPALEENAVGDTDAAEYDNIE